MGSLKRVSARTHPHMEDGTDEASARAGGTPWKVPDPGRRGILSSPGLCRPGLSAASTQETPGVSAPRLPSHRRNSLRPFEPDLAPRDAAPRPDTSGGAPLTGGMGDVKAQSKNIVKDTGPAAIPAPSSSGAAPTGARAPSEVCCIKVLGSPLRC